MESLLDYFYHPIPDLHTNFASKLCSHRALRQQFGCSHQSASAGICVDDVKDKSDEDGQNKEECRNKNNSWRDRCKYSSEWDGAQNEQGHRTEPHNFWRHVQGPGPVVEAIGVGGVIALGIQLSHFKCLHRKARAPEERKKHCLLYKVVYALPTLHETSSRRSITNTHSQTKKQEISEQIEPKPPEVQTLDEAFVKFQDVCRNYTATGKGIMGNQAAVTGNLATAAILWTESSQLGHPKAQYNLALCYETGRGVEKNMKEALKYYQLAAEAEHPQAMYNLALLYLEGDSQVPQDRDQGLHLLTRAADHGLVNAQRYLGVYFTEEDSEDIESALKYISMAAEHQDAESQYNLGQCYEHGVGVKQDTCRAASLYSQAAHSGHTDAIYNLGLFHLQGEGGLGQNGHSAATLFQKAADMGHQEAKHELDKLSQDQMSSSSDQHPTYVLRLNSSVSTPCLTDHVRDNIIQVGTDTLYDPVSEQGTLSQLYTQLVSPRALTELPSLTQVSRSPTRKNSKTPLTVTRTDSNSDSGVMFSLCFENSDDLSVDVDRDKFTGVSAMRNIETVRQDPSAACATMHRRTATMPELLHTMV